MPLLDRELDVLHVAVVVLEPRHRVEQLLVRLGEALRHLFDGLRRADAGDDVLALRIDEVLAVDALLAGRRVAREAHAGRRALALVPEHHLHDVDGRAEIVRDVVRAPVDVRARVLPRLEDGEDRAAELLARILRERAADLLAVDVLEGLDERRQVVRAQVDVELDAAIALQVRERPLETMAVDAVDDLAEHLDQAPVRVACEARVARRPDEPSHGVVAQAEVEDRVHHPRHRDRGAGAHGQEERVLGVAEALSGLLLEAGDVLVDLVVEPWNLVAAVHERAAGVGGDGEAGGDGNPELGHLSQPDSLAAEELAATVGGLVERVYVPGHERRCCHTLKTAHADDHRHRRFPERGDVRVRTRVTPAAGASSSTSRIAAVRRPPGRAPRRFHALLLLPLAAGGPARARPRPRRHLRLRGQHGEHARRLARSTASTGSSARRGTPASSSPAGAPG